MTDFERIDKYVIEKGVVPAKMMKDLGFSTGLYSQWRKGLQKPSKSKIIAIAQYLSLPVEALLYDGEPIALKATESEWDSILDGLSDENLENLRDYVKYLYWKQTQEASNNI